MLALEAAHTQMASSMTWTAASILATLTQRGLLTPCGTGLWPHLSQPPPMKPSTRQQPLLATPRLPSSATNPLPTALQGTSNWPPAWRPRGLASLHTPRRTSPARPWFPRHMPRTPAPCYQRRKTYRWTALPWRSRTASRMTPSWLAPRGRDPRQVSYLCDGDGGDSVYPPEVVGRIKWDNKCKWDSGARHRVSTSISQPLHHHSRHHSNRNNNTINPQRFNPCPAHMPNILYAQPQES
ncbi:transcription factor Spi-B isoform X3 [Symphalangus syndactylus]|uniref:transcription factor Spi-B isoform X3 n=1 Tax=Symphalangus syndactylus TaxID=9590 RepID=UPI00300532B3